MWAALRSDLQEFVSGVADETEVVLQTTGGTPSRVNDEGEMIGDDFDATGAVQSASDEVARRQNQPETYSEPLDEGDEGVQAFLDDFVIDNFTDQIATLLEDHPDTIKVQFEALVPTQISYALFWQRYFYRCDEDLIQEEWNEQQVARQEAQEARAQAIAGGIQSVTNLFGGALNAVSATLEKADSSGGGGVPMSPFIDSGGATPKDTSGGGGMNLFGSGGRPPFVMNTAVGEDDDDEEEEEEEEEELGWDDDDDEDLDDDDDEEEEDHAADVSEEQITFSGGNNDAVNKLSEELAQALSERDALKETISLQQKEIVALKEDKDESMAVEKLKMTIFEKDAELAAMKASLEDTHDEDGGASSKKHSAKIAALERDVERLTKELGESKEEFDKAKTVAADIEAELTSAENKAAVQDAELKNTKTQLEETLAVLNTSQEECSALRRALENNDDLAVAEQEARDNVKTLEAELEAARAEADSLRRALENNDDFAVAEQEARDNVRAMDAEMEATKQALEAQKSRAQELELEVTALKKSATAGADLVKQELADSQKHAQELEQEVKKLKKEMEGRVEAPVVAAPVVERAITPQATTTGILDEEHRLSPGSDSTGVKVEEPLPISVAKTDDDDDDDIDVEEEEGWGDDWGDDDDA